MLWSFLMFICCAVFCAIYCFDLHLFFVCCCHLSSVVLFFFSCQRLGHVTGSRAYTPRWQSMMYKITVLTFTHTWPHITIPNVVTPSPLQRPLPASGPWARATSVFGSRAFCDAAPTIWNSLTTYWSHFNVFSSAGFKRTFINWFYPERTADRAHPTQVLFIEVCTQSWRRRRLIHRQKRCPRLQFVSPVWLVLLN